MDIETQERHGLTATVRVTRSPNFFKFLGVPVSEASNAVPDQNDPLRSGWRDPFLDRPFRPHSTDPYRASLAEAKPGQTLEVTDIFFQLVRNRCWECGMSEGSVVECLDVTNEQVVLDHPEHGLFALERSYARFVRTALVAERIELRERSA